MRKSTYLRKLAKIFYKRLYTKYGDNPSEPNNVKKRLKCIFMMKKYTFHDEEITRISVFLSVGKKSTLSNWIGGVVCANPT